MKRTLYECMEPSITSAFIPRSLDDPVTEIQDFDRVIQFYWARIRRFILASVRDRDVAETLTQDCFWSAYRSRMSFRGDSTLHAWLMRIAINSVRKHLRNRRLQFWRQVQHSAVSPAEIAEWLPDRRISPEGAALVQEHVRAVWSATADLSERQRTVFLLRFMEDMNIQEIADSTGLTESAVNVHLFRAVRAVRKRLGRDNE
jgi:RNA polymerase sigma-70 factor (ECF subfamily)